MEWTIDNGSYVTTVDGIKIKIKKGNLTSATHNCCLKVTKLYKENEDKVVQAVAEKLLEQGKVYDQNLLRKKMGAFPEIEIFAKGNDAIIWFIFFMDNKKVVCEYEESMCLRSVRLIDKAVAD